MSRVIPLGEGAGSLLLVSPHVPLPFADFALYPLIVINHSCEYDCVLSPVNHHTQGWLWGAHPCTINDHLGRGGGRRRTWAWAEEELEL